MINSGLQAGEFTASLVQRKQQQRNDDARLALQQRQQDLVDETQRILMPVRQAQAQADMAGAQVELENQKQLQDQRKAAYSLLPAARTEFDGLMHVTDPDQRAEAGIQWIGKYGQLDNFKELNAEFSSKKEIAAKLHTEATALRTMKQQHTDQLGLIDARGNVARDVANIRNEKLTPIERYKQQRDQAAADGDSDGTAFYDALIQKQTAAPISTAEGSDQFQKKYADVLANGTDEEKKFWTDRTKAINTRGVKQSGVMALRDALLGNGPTPTATPAPAVKPPTSPKPTPAATGTDSISNLQF